jgi:hypothetical protein
MMLTMPTHAPLCAAALAEAGTRLGLGTALRNPAHGACRACACTWGPCVCFGLRRGGEGVRRFVVLSVEELELLALEMGLEPQTAAAALPRGAASLTRRHVAVCLCPTPV